MLKNYLKIAFRSIVKNPGYSFLNVMGLSLGLTCSIIIFLYVQDELGYDKSHKNADRIYRAVCTYYLPNDAGVEHNAIMGPPVGPLLVADYPEIKQAVRFQRRQNKLVEDANGNRFFETIYYADSNMFNLFTIPLLRGDPNTALEKPFNVLLSKEMALKYYNTLDIVGEQINFPEDSTQYTITGVLATQPNNTHLRFNFLASFETLPAMGAYMLSWWSFGTWTYLELDPNSDQAEVSEKIKLISRNYIADQEDGSGYKQEYSLQKLTDIHLTSDLRGEIEPNSNKAYVYIFLLVGISILVIACINFMNLATARSALRAKEIGVRKVSGAHRSQLIGQFLGEAFVLTLLSVIIAMVFIALTLPEVNDFMGKSLTFNFYENPIYLLEVLALTVLVGLSAGSYPAALLSAFKPTETLKGSFKSSGKGNVLRKALVVFQFTISILLIGGTLVIYNQLEYMRTKNLGFAKDQILYIPSRYTNNALSDFKILKQELESISTVEAATLSGRVPGLTLSNNVVRLGWNDDAEWSDMRFLDVDEDFVPLYDLKLIAGRNFDKNRPSDVEEAFILNESGINRLGWSDPEEALNKPLRWQNRNGRVVGVLKDFHFMSVNEDIQPFIMMLGGNRTPGYLSVKIRGSNIAETVRVLENKYQEVIPGNEFEYFFLDNEFDQQYKAEDRFMALFTLFSGLAIIIACLGLYGLAAFIANLKTKEIGIRKVLGASSTSLLILLNKDFTKLILFAMVVAIPVGYFSSSTWLESFPYHIEVSFVKFLLAGIISILIAWLTVSYQSIKASRSNPVDAIAE